MKNREKEHFVKTILEASDILAKIGWSIAIPNEDEPNHLLVGEEEKLAELINDLNSDYEIMTKESQH